MTTTYKELLKKELLDALRPFIGSYITPATLHAMTQVVKDTVEESLKNMKVVPVIPKANLAYSPPDRIAVTFDPEEIRHPFEE